VATKRPKDARCSGPPQADVSRSFFLTGSSEIGLVASEGMERPGTSEMDGQVCEGNR
jgi:hypothetical protein